MYLLGLKLCSRVGKRVLNFLYNLNFSLIFGDRVNYKGGLIRRIATHNPSPPLGNGSNID